jgi:hypothetical protein
MFKKSLIRNAALTVSILAAGASFALAQDDETDRRPFAKSPQSFGRKR